MTKSAMAMAIMAILWPKWPHPCSSAPQGREWNRSRGIKRSIVEFSRNRRR